MKTQLKLIAVFHLLLVICLSASAQGTAFTYQGRLNDGGSPANGSYDFRFRLASDALGNNLVTGPVLSNAAPVSSGLFTVALDFGAGIFAGSNYWLQVDVKTNNAGSYTTLTPLQALTPTPYAIFAGGASNVFGAVPAAQLSGTIASPQLAGAYASPLNFNNAANQFSGTFNGDGGALSNVNAAALGGLAASNFWQTSGNSGTSPSANFVGTSDNQPLEFRVNGQRVLRLTPNSNGGPNFLGGATVNQISPGIVGATIVGGGAASYFGFPYTNSITSDFGFVGGGTRGAIGTNSPFSAVVGGEMNQIGASSGYSFIGGGTDNQIQDGARFSTISGGAVNQIGTNSTDSTVGGGDANFIFANAGTSTIGGGGGNRILDGSLVGTIAGGDSNQILTNCTFSTIGGGFVNHIGSFSDYSVVGGGNRNAVLTNSQYAIIGGGNFNTIQGDASYSLIAGGNFNTIQGDASYSLIAGGNFNTNGGYVASISGGDFNAIQFAADHTVIAGGGNNTIVGSLQLPVYDTIGGGLQNTMQTNSIFSVIAGGRANVVQAGAAYATISGGSGNTIFGGPANATICGGTNNAAGANAATVVGGFGNVAASPASTVVGGQNNTAAGFAAIAMGQSSTASGNYSLAAGFRAQATNVGAFVWTDLAGPNFSSTNDNSFNVRATGGVRFLTSGAGLSLDGPLNVTGGGISGSLDAGNISTGTLADARLSGNVALLNAPNIFSATNSFSTRVGIGTTAPEAPLHVANGSAGSVAVNPNSIAVFEKSGSGYVSILGPLANEVGILFGNSNSGANNGTDGGMLFNSSGNSRGLQFRTGTNTTRMVIQNSGNVGIGTTSPSRELEVQSSGDTEIGIKSTDTGSHLWTLQSSGVTGSANLDASFQIIDRTTGVNSSRFYIGTNGFVGIGTTGPTNKLHVNGGITCTALTQTSDRNAKENFAPVDSREVLAKVVALPITTWNFRELRDGRHLGPMAQDFYAAFHLGNSDATITSVDPDGVALAAIQGLNQKFSEQEAALKNKDSEIQELRQAIAALQQTIRKIVKETPEQP